MHTKRRRRRANLKKLPMSKEAYLIQKTPERGESLKPASRFATSLAFGSVHHMKKWVEEEMK